MIHGKSLCLAADRPGTQTLQLRLLPVIGKDGFSISLPPCPSAIFETGGLPADQAVALHDGSHEETLAAGQIRPLPHSGRDLTIRTLGQPRNPRGAASARAIHLDMAASGARHPIGRRAVLSDHHPRLRRRWLRAWRPCCHCRRMRRTSPSPARTWFHTRKSAERTARSGFPSTWKTRGILDRQIVVSYRMPLRPLDRTWHLQAPGGEGTRTRFIIASSPLLAYSAKDLSGPLSPRDFPPCSPNRSKEQTAIISKPQTPPT